MRVRDRGRRGGVHDHVDDNLDNHVERAGVDDDVFSAGGVFYNDVATGYFHDSQTNHDYDHVAAGVADADDDRRGRE